MSMFTQLERSVLDAICAVRRPSMPRLRQALSTAVVISRENTGHGFYTGLRAAPSSDDLWVPMIDGPSALMLHMGEGAVMGFILWCSERGPTTLEGFQMGNVTGNTVDLRTRDLGTLRFSEIAY